MKRILLGLAALVGVLVLAVGAVLGNAHLKFESVRNQVHEDPSLELVIPTDEAAIIEGERISRMKGCADCHGADMAGKVFVEDPAIGFFAGRNLTRGLGGIGGVYTDHDWVRAIRYGRGPDRKYLRFMPSEEYAALTDEDLGKLIAYLKSVPATDREPGQVRPGPMAKVLFSFGQMPLLFSGQNVNDKAGSVASLKASESIEYGKYIAASCVGCHQPNYGGGKIPGVPPHWPPAANLTPKGAFADWNFEDLQKLAKTGENKEGKTLNPQFMPWPAMSAMNETELKALYNFLKSLPAAETN